MTAHRRESFGEPIRQICRAVAQLHERFSDVEFLWPVHPNPAIRTDCRGDVIATAAHSSLSPPLAYGPFVSALKRSTLVLTDSGGIQEEAPALGKPVLVLRAESERPEAIASGVAMLVGHDPGTIVAEVSRLLDDSAAYGSMAKGTSPYGDGQAARRIVSGVAQFPRRRRHDEDRRLTENEPTMLSPRTAISSCRGPFAGAGVLSEQRPGRDVPQISRGSAAARRKVAQIVRLEIRLFERQVGLTDDLRQVCVVFLRCGVIAHKSRADFDSDSAPGHELRATGHRPRATGHEPRATGR